jgi:hypothetical protein
VILRHGSPVTAQVYIIEEEEVIEAFQPKIP